MNQATVIQLVFVSLLAVTNAFPIEKNICAKKVRLMRIIGATEEFNLNPKLLQNTSNHLIQKKHLIPQFPEDSDLPDLSHTEIVRQTYTNLYVRWNLTKEVFKKTKVKNTFMCESKGDVDDGEVTLMEVSRSNLDELQTALGNFNLDKDTVAKMQDSFQRAEEKYYSRLENQLSNGNNDKQKVLKFYACSLINSDLYEILRTVLRHKKSPFDLCSRCHNSNSLSSI